MFTKTVVVAALAAVGSAQVPAVARREFIEARQTQSLDATCQSAIASLYPLYTDVPTPPADLTIASAAIPTDPCATPSFTGTLSAEYASYTSEVLVWYSSHSAQILSALASCPALTSYETAVPVCSTFALGGSGSSVTTTGSGSGSSSTASSSSGSGSGSGSGSSSGSGSGSGSSNSSSTSSTGSPTKNIAPRETGLIAAAIAAAGFIGAAAIAL